MNVPPDVIARLEVMAAIEQPTVSAIGVRELAALSRPAHNARLLDALSDTGLSTQVLLEHLDTGRDDR